MGKVCLGAFTIGGAFLAVVALREDAEELLEGLIQPPELIWKGVLLGGLAFCGIGVLLIIFLLLQVLLVQNRIADSAERLGEYLELIAGKLEKRTNYEHSQASEDDLKTILEFSREQLGEDIDEDVEKLMYGWYRKNPTMLWIVYSVTTTIKKSAGQERTVRSRRVAGYFNLMPLKKKAARLVGEGKLYGSKIASDDMVTVNTKPSAIYVGGISADSPAAKAHALMAVMGRLGKQMKRGVEIYTRPVSKDGLRLARKYGFEPVQEANGLDAMKVVHKMATKQFAEAVAAKLSRSSVGRS